MSPEGVGSRATTRNGLPTAIEEMPPGPGLGDLLEGVDRSGLNGYELVLLLQARSRQISRIQAEFYADMAELAHSAPCRPDDPPERLQIMDEFACDEIRTALGLTRQAADFNLSVAWRLVDRLPDVWRALHAGHIDLPRARAILDRTDHLDEAIAREIADEILPEAGELTTGQLRRRIDRLCTDSNPDDAADRYRKGLDDRSVESGGEWIEPSLAGESRLCKGVRSILATYPFVSNRQPNGTASLHGMNLPADRVAAVMDRLTDIARWRRAADEPRTMDQLRADAFLELLEGRLPQESPRRPMVDIRVELPTLLGLEERAGEIPGWGPVISDIARQVVERQPDGEWRVAVTDPDTGNILWDGTTRRRPTAAQRRWVEARQTTCVFPGCSYPARRADLDHSIEVQKGGQTLVRLLEPACRHDHILRHEGGWELVQPRPGRYEWTSPRGHTYVTGRAPP